jgi:hypothetical protein
MTDDELLAGLSASERKLLLLLERRLLAHLDARLEDFRQRIDEALADDEDDMLDQLADDADERRN